MNAEHRDGSRKLDDPKHADSRRHEWGTLADDPDVWKAAEAMAATGADEPHPPMAELVAYHEERLTGEAAEAIRTHLAGCASCTELFLDFAAFEEGGPPPGRPPLSELDMARARRRFDDRLRQEESTPPARKPSPWLPLAASVLLVGSLLVSAFLVHTNAELREEIAAMQDQPAPEQQIRMAQVDVRNLTGETLRSDAALVVQRGQELVVELLLNPDAAEARRLTALLETEEGEDIVRNTSLRPRSGGLQLSFGPGLPEGIYRLSLLRDGTTVQVFSFHLKRPEG